MAESDGNSGDPGGGSGVDGEDNGGTLQTRERSVTAERRNLEVVKACENNVILVENGSFSEKEDFEKLNSFGKMRYVKPLTLFQDLLKTNALERGRFLGLDVGDKYVGLAVSDPENKIAMPLSVLLRKKFSIDMMATDFTSLISQFSLSGFVVGCPFDRQRQSPDGFQVKVFVDDLCKTKKLEGVNYTFWNECFTSKNVDLLLKPLSLHPVELKTMLDKLAAVGILQGYLDYVNRIGLNLDVEDHAGNS